MKGVISLPILSGIYLSLALLGGRGNELQAQSTYKEIDVKDGGSIRGIVRLNGDGPKIGSLEVTKDAEVCGKRKPYPRLAVGKNNGVRNAVVFIEGISRGKKAIDNIQPILDQHKCEYVPHVMILPMGAPLEILNSDRILHNVHAYDVQHDSRTLFNIAQPIKGQRTPIKTTQFVYPGLVLATCDAGHPWMSAYIMLAEHPYYAVTDAEGKFVLGNVPPGSYKVKMWHEGVAIIKTELEKGKPRKYIYEDSYQEIQEVTVTPNGSATIDFELTLRSESLSQ